MTAWQELLSERMKLAEETGSCATQRHLVSSFREQVSREGDEWMKREFAEFADRVEANILHEMRCGEHGLLVEEPSNRGAELGLRDTR